MLCLHDKRDSEGWCVDLAAVKRSTKRIHSNSSLPVQRKAQRGRPVRFRTPVHGLTSDFGTRMVPRVFGSFKIPLTSKPSHVGRTLDELWAMTISMRRRPLLKILSPPLSERQGSLLGLDWRRPPLMIVAWQALAGFVDRASAPGVRLLESRVLRHGNFCPAVSLTHQGIHIIMCCAHTAHSM